MALDHIALAVGQLQVHRHISHIVGDVVDDTHNGGARLVDVGDGEAAQPLDGRQLHIAKILRE